MKVVLVGMFFLLGGVHSSCFRLKEGENSSWEWSPKIGSKKHDVASVEDCQKICVDNYECVAMTYKVRLLDRIYSRRSVVSLLVLPHHRLICMNKKSDAILFTPILSTNHNLSSKCKKIN